MNTSQVVLGLLQLLGTWAVGSLAGAGLTVLALRTWISERIKGSIKAEYDERIETLKAQLKSEYDQKLETHKAQLKAQSDVEIEQLKSRLSVAAAQQQVRFSRLHEKRAEVITEVYASLNTLLGAVSEYTAVFEPAGISPREERAKKAVEAINTFMVLYRDNKIFIPRPTTAKLDQIQSAIRGAFIEFQWGVDYVVRSTRQSGDTDKWLKVSQTLENVSKVALIELEDDLRRLLGEETQHASAPASA
jgi:hypothetical protein